MPNGQAPPPQLDKRKLIRGVTVFVVLTLAGLTALFVVTNRDDLAVPALSADFFGLALAAMLADLLIGAIRYQIFLVRIKPGISLWVPIKADLATRFTGAVTPSQTGGGPAQLFVLWKEGIPVPSALSFLMINLFSTLLFFLVAGGVTAWLLRSYYSAGTAQLLLTWGFGSFALAFAFILTALVRPDLIARALTPLMRRLESRPTAWAVGLARGGRVLVGSVEKYREACMEFIRVAPWLPVASFVLTAMLYTNKFFLGYLVVRGLGVEAPFLTVIGAQVLVHLVTFIIPTPGGSGLAELSTGAIMSSLLPLSLLGPFTLAQRFFLIWVPSAAGAVVLAQVLRTGVAPAEHEEAGPPAPA